MSIGSQAVGWMRALLAFLVAVALLVAPVAGARAMPCHEPSHHHSAAAVGSGHHEAGSAAHAAKGHSRAVDHSLCCSSACASCVVMLAAAGTSIPHRVALAPAYERRDEIGTGLAFPPTLGPPRHPA
ncbi:hypothetical protein [Roseixanthobacter liquoris]|uniref:hypothetical protein n=1 Tax=Roseixanthobacter liquoris TaxID=3119921 RepID=UPI00372767C6